MEDRLVGVAEVAQMLGISRQRVNQMVTSAPDFPGPEAQLSAGRIWRVSLVKAWMDAHPDRSKRGSQDGEARSEVAELKISHKPRGVACGSGGEYSRGASGGIRLLCVGYSISIHSLPILQLWWIKGG